MPKLVKATRKTTEEVKPKAEEVFEEEKSTPKVKPKVVKKIEFDQNDRIKCRSVTQGGLFVEGPKTKVLYEFSDYGDETEIEYRDLVGLVHAKSDYLFRPNLVVENKDFIAEYPQLDKLYSDTYGTQDLLDLFSLPVDEMMKKIKGLPSGAIENLKHLAATQVANGQLDSVQKIKALDEFWGTDLNLAAGLMHD